MNDEAQRNYSQYVSWQVEKTDYMSQGGGPAPAQWVMEPEIAKAAEYARLHLPLRNRFALSHGSRSGREVSPGLRRPLPILNPRPPPGRAPSVPLGLSTHTCIVPGPRRGQVLWFRRHLPHVQTWGTELSGIAAAKAAWTFQHDFNVVRPVTYWPHLSNPPADRLPTLTPTLAMRDPITNMTQLGRSGRVPPISSTPTASTTHSM